MDTDGLEAVLMSNRPVLLRFLAARGAGADAEDLLQELWAKASQNHSGPIADPLAYLYRMADNLLLDLRRAGQRRIQRDDAWQSTRTTAAGISDQPSQERVLLARERLRKAEAALAALGDKTAAVFRSYRIEGVAQRDIAAALGISLSAVEKHLQKAYRVLAELRATETEDSPFARRHVIEQVDDAAE